MIAKSQRRTARAAGFTLIELIAAFGIFVMVSSAFFSSSRALGAYMERLSLQSEAVSVLDNTVARVAARPEPVADAVLAVFQDEFRKSGLPSGGRIKAVGEVREGRLHLEIVSVQGRILASIAFPLAEQERL